MPQSNDVQRLAERVSRGEVSDLRALPRQEPCTPDEKLGRSTMVPWVSFLVNPKIEEAGHPAQPLHCSALAVRQKETPPTRKRGIGT